MRQRRRTVRGTPEGGTCCCAPREQVALPTAAWTGSKRTAARPGLLGCCRKPGRRLPGAEASLASEKRAAMMSATC